MATTTGARTSPEELFLRWRDGGDAAAMAALFDAEAPVLFRTAIVLCSDPLLAEEAVQETFLAAMESPGNWDDARRVGPWLTGILRIKILELRRREGRRPDPRRLPPPPPPDDPVVATAMAEDVERVRAAIRALPEPYRSVALLRWVHGLEPAAIADLREEPPGTVWSILSRAMAKLRRELGGLPVLALLMPESGGLPAVRERVLERARAPRPAPGGRGPAAAGGRAAAPAAAPAKGGGIPAGTLAAGLAALLVLGLAGLRLAGSGGRGAPDAPEGGRVAAAPAPAPPAAPDPPAPEDPLAGLPPPADPASFDGERDLFGVVVDVEGRPVPGAAVTASFRPYGDVFFLGFEESRARVPGPSTRSARDGTFLLPLPRGTWCDLRAEAPGVGEAQAGWRVAGERVRLVLREARSLLVRALDAGGNPVAGLRLHPSWMDESRRTCQLPSGTTGADGTCLLRSLPAGRIWFTLEHPDLRGPSPAEAVVPERGTGSFEIRLSPPRVVEGIVVDARTRAPLPGAVVGDGYLLLHARAAGPDGRFSFPCDPLDSRTVVHARAPGYAPGSSAPGADGTLEIALRPGAAAEGRLLGEGGRPADGVRVDVIGYAPKASGWSGAQAASARTGDGGRFRLEGLRAGTSYTMVCEAPGRGRLVRDFAAAAEEGGTADLGDILLPPSRSIEGILLDEAGEPLPDRPVVLHGPLGEVAPSGRSLDVGRRTDDRGRFRFAGRSPGAYRVAAGADARSAGAALDVLLPEDGDLADLVLRVPAAVRAEILVTDPAGEPVPGMGLLLLGPAGNAQLRSDERGRASAPVIPGESYRLHATDLSVPVRWVSALPGGTPVEPGAGEVRLVVRRAAQVRGRVVGGDGLPVEGATVTAREAGGPGSWSLRTLSDGRFDFPVPRGARLEVAAAGEGGSRSRAVEALAPGEDVDLRLEGGGRLVLRVRVLDAEGRPVPGIPLDAPVVQGREPTTDRRGEALLRGLGAGAIRVGVRPGAALPEGAAAPPPAEADPADGEVVLRLREGVPIEGLVLGPDGLPAPGAAVRLLCADGSGAGAAADGTGRFRALVGPGTAVLRAEARWTDAGGEPRTALLEGAAAGAAVLEFRLR